MAGARIRVGGVLTLLLAACGPADVEPPTARAVLPPPLRPPVPVARPEPAPPIAEPPEPTRPPAPPDIGGGHGGERPPPLDIEPLPPPWPRAAFDVAATSLGRRVVAAEDIVGLVSFGDDGALAVDATGGLFRGGPMGAFRPEPTALPDGVTRLFAMDDALVACGPGEARFSLDRGLSWGRLGFACGAEGRRTIAVTEGRVYALAGGRLRVGPVPSGRFELLDLPLAAPVALGAKGEHVVVFGADGDVAWSEDGGATFEPAVLPSLALEEVRDVAFGIKGVAVAVGRSAPDRPTVLVSRDAGRSWLAEVDLPRRTDDLAAVAANALGHFVAVPAAPGGVALRSDHSGRGWAPVDVRAPLQGAVTAHRGGFLLGTPRGVAHALEVRGPRRAGLDRVLWDAVYLHPQVAVGAGADGGLFRTTDGGVTWWLVPGTEGVRFDGVAAPGGAGVVAVGRGLFWRSEDAGARWTQTPPPSSCAVRWVRFAGESGAGLAGCAAGEVLRSDDGGRAWRVVAELARPIEPVAWLDAQRAAALDADRGKLYVTSDRGASWQTLPLALDDEPVHLESAPLGLSLVTRSGALGTTTDPHGGWSWRRPEVPLAGEVRWHRMLAEDRVLVLTDRALHDVRGARVHLLGSTPGAERFTLTGDGGVLVVQETATSLLEPR